MVVMMFRIALRPLVEHSVSRIFRMALFWHFLDFVWIFIFTVVYGIGYLLSRIIMHHELSLRITGFIASLSINTHCLFYYFESRIF